MPVDDQSSTAPAEYLVEVAGHTLDFFGQTATSALAELGGARLDAGAAFAGMNSFTDDRPSRRLQALNSEREYDLRTLAAEPAIARIVAEVDGGAPKVLYVSRASPSRPSMGGSAVASYRGPLGRLASLRIGGSVEISTPMGDRTYTVLQRATLIPRLDGDEWDSVDSRVEGTSFAGCTVKSFRALLRVPEADLEAPILLDEWLREGRVEANVALGFRRAVRERMALRDQPLLDERQDKVFRLPLSSRLAILGPPGTGKTTTLIKRLGLKLDVAFLSEAEERQVEESAVGRAGHARGWIMFTPSDLLRQYVKEAFAREGVPASDSHIRTWADYRRELARQTFGFVRRDVGAGTRGFVLRDGNSALLADTSVRQAAWSDDFDGWQKASFGADLRENAQALTRLGDAVLAPMGRQIEGVVADGAFGPESDLPSLNEIGVRLRPLLPRARGDADEAVKGLIAREVQRDRSVLTRLFDVLSRLSGDTAVEADGDGDADIEEEEEVRAVRTDREAALAALERAIRDQARQAASGRPANPRSRAARMLDALGIRLAAADLAPLGTRLQALASANRLADPVGWYFREMSARYRRFRRARSAEGRWYVKEGVAPGDIGPLETDVLLLSILRGMRDLLTNRSVARGFAAGDFQALKTAREIFRTQVAADEATDFSPVQLACMASLSDPAARSFIACGDFHQRITSWGSRSVADLEWAVTDVEVHRFTVSYRHSRQLLELAGGIVGLSDPAAGPAELPLEVDNEGVKPLLLTGLADRSVVAERLAAAIGYVESSVGKLPTIAVFVDDEAEVVPVAEALDAALAEQSIRAVPCQRGMVVGQDNDVRVFDVQHIKGLEFEAVFFVGVDRLARDSGDIFDNYLYVGATRAAMYLGITTAESSLPARISGLVHYFTDAWPPL